MRCLLACCFGLTLLIAVGGCRSCDRVESELRACESNVRELREELDRCGIYNQSLQQEVLSLRGQLGVPADGSSPSAAYPVQSLVLGRQTGGRSNDVCPGDDALQVQVEPRDPEGQAIKAPGQLLIQAQEIASDGIKRPLSSWAIPPEQLRRSWKNGLLTTGYVLNLPWKVWPSSEKLRVTAQFQLADGRVFEADRDVTVRLTPLNQRPTVVPNTPSPPAPSFPPSPQPANEAGPALLPAPRLISPTTPIPTEAGAGPILGASRRKSNVPQTVEPPSAAEILHPVPLKPEVNPH